MLHSGVVFLLALSFAQGLNYYYQQSYSGGRYGNPRFEGCRLPSYPGLVIKPMKSSYGRNEVVELSCEEGYKFNNKEKNTTCLVFSPGFFGNEGVFMPGIFPDTCKELPLCRKPTGEGMIIDEEKSIYDVGEEIKISCEDGYELIGDKDTFKCEEFRTYYGSRATFGISRRSICREVRDCRQLKQPGLIVTPEKDMYKPGENITLACKEGYELAVNEISTCQTSGIFKLKKQPGKDDQQWSDIFILGNRACIRKPQCGKPYYKGAVMVPQKNVYELGDKINVTCEEGFELEDENIQTLTCSRRGDMMTMFSRGEFKPKMNKVCRKKVMCTVPMIQGLIVTPEKDLYDVGETVKYSCRPGFKFIGKVDNATCQSMDRHYGYLRGQFSPRISYDVCRRIPSCDKPNSEGLILSPERDFYDIGDKIEISCEEGYEQTVASMVTCVRSRRSAKGFYHPQIGWAPCIKPVTCEAPSDENAIVQPKKDSYDEGDGISVTCKPGYQISGDGEFICERSAHCRWQEGKITGCFYPELHGILCFRKPSCMKPEGEGLVVRPDKDEYSPGEDISVSCAENYQERMQLRSKVTCQRVWRGEYKFRIPGNPCKKMAETRSLPITEQTPKAMVTTPKPMKVTSTSAASVEESSGFEPEPESSGMAIDLTDYQGTGGKKKSG